MSSSSPESSIDRSGVRLRPLAPSDRAPLEAILRDTGAFDEAEVRVALELIDCGLSADTEGYRFQVAERGGEVAGYACWGTIPLTDASFDLYWIAVDPALQRAGVGRALLESVERAVAAEGGRWLLIETASKPSYAATRAFYERTGYTVIARIADFYRLGDDKLVFGKRLDRAGAAHA